MRFQLFILSIVSTLMFLFFCINDILPGYLKGIFMGLSLSVVIIFIVYQKIFLKKKKY